jgi:hypothetical protein
LRAGSPMTGGGERITDPARSSTVSSSIPSYLG